MTTSITTTSLSDALPSTVPKLDPSGANWAIFVFRFEDAVSAKGYWGHFDGSVSRPEAADSSSPTAVETTAISQWDKDERSARLVFQGPVRSGYSLFSAVTVTETGHNIFKFSK
jgi:hypothetical protein